MIFRSLWYLGLECIAMFLPSQDRKCSPRRQTEESSNNFPKISIQSMWKVLLLISLEVILEGKFMTFLTSS
ncbi:hypothetical protein BDA96_02G389900 [Sorghum bicolor]|uniref:Uncharacterized protein n=1 Tax=Sorghum bicolor TaxID=4558 RepID=A0A921RT86_SORBI|nr:hypothetical protein BDA96_02G389900 [Sorghum bicolor]